ncbi:16469_t:CDS:1, partial [Cetraspora pellucida]
ANLTKCAVSTMIFIVKIVSSGIINSSQILYVTITCLRCVLAANFNYLH